MRTAGSIIYSKRYNEDEEFFKEIFGEFENEKSCPMAARPKKKQQIGEYDSSRRRRPESLSFRISIL